MRGDDLPTQHMRALAYWMAAPGLEGMTSVQVCGSEWVSHVTCRRQLMGQLMADGGKGMHPSSDIFHGMVSRQKRAIASSEEGALLIDELTEWLQAQIESDPGSEQVIDRLGSAERIAGQVALGFFVPRPVTPRVDFQPEKLLDVRESPGWELALARARDGSGADAGGRARARPRLPLRGRAVRAAQAPSAHRGRALGPGAAGSLRRAPRALVPGARAQRAGATGRAHATGARRARPGIGGGSMTTLLVDNYDSYTYNVFHLLAAVSGEEPIVIQNDAVSWSALSRWDFDAIVISPGPGRPERWHDFGVCSDILRWSEVPILGICLGHQGLGQLLEGTVTAAPMPMHGRVSHVRHVGHGLFAGIPQNFSVVRYHSLAVTGPMAPTVASRRGRTTAW